MPFALPGGVRLAVLADCAFVVCIAVMWLLHFTLADHWASDMLTCHLPMTRLLSEDWNPVLDSMCESTCGALGLRAWDMSYYHVVFSPKAVAVFNAVAFSFVRDPFAVSYPIIFLLGLAFLLKAIDSFRDMHWGAGLVLAAATVLGLGYWLYLPVDAAMAFGVAVCMRPVGPAQKSRYGDSGGGGASCLSVEDDGISALSAVGLRFRGDGAGCRCGFSAGEVASPARTALGGHRCFGLADDSCLAAFHWRGYRSRETRRTQEGNPFFLIYQDVQTAAQAIGAGFAVQGIL